MKKRFTFRRSVGLTPAIAKRVQSVARFESRSFESALRLLIWEALRSRDSLKKQEQSNV